MKYHLYKRVIRGKTVWYYWFYGSDKKQIRKSCHTSIKKEAQAFIEKLIEIDRQNEGLLKGITLEDVATDMWKEGSLYLQLLENKGIVYAKKTLLSKRAELKNYILPKFGKRDPATIEDAEVENYLLQLKGISNSSKNSILGTYIQTMKECKRNKIIKHTPDISRFKNNSKRKDIFTYEELKLLFPDDVEEFETLWSFGRKMYLGVDKQIHYDTLAIGYMLLLMVTTGMRPGEARGIFMDQLFDEGIYLTHMVDSSGDIQNYLKMGSQKNPKHRIVILPTFVKKRMNRWLEIKENSDFLFSYEQKPFAKNRTADVLKFMLEKLNINSDNARILSPHSCRYTFNTLVVDSNKVPSEVLRKLVGHESEEMTQHYTQSYPQLEIQNLLKYKDSLDDIFSR